MIMSTIHDGPHAPRSANLNGGWPEGLSADPPEFPSLPPDASLRDYAHHYGSVTTTLTHMLPKIVQALEFLRDAGHDMAVQLGAVKGMIERAKVPSVPPMRPPLDSSHDAIEQAQRETEMRVKAEAARTPGPQVDPEAASRIASEVFARKMAEREDEIKARADADRLAALEAAEAQRVSALKAVEDQRKEDTHKLRQKIIAAIAVWVVLGVLGTMAGLMWLGARVAVARQMGHAEGVSEVRSIVTVEKSAATVAPAASQR
jgi:hypothetical protein